MSNSQNAAIFIYDEAINGPQSNIKVFQWDRYQNSTCDNIKKEEGGYERLFYCDPAFSFQIPGSMTPYDIFPNLRSDMNNSDTLKLLTEGSSDPKIPYLFFSSAKANKESGVMIKFHHNTGQIPTIEQKFQIKIDNNTKISNFLQPILDQKTWRPSIEHIAKQLEIDVDRIVLYLSTEEGNKVLFPFQNISSIANRVFDQNTGKYIFTGQFSFEILPNLYDNIESNENQLKDKFIDNEEERNSFFNSLPPSLMAQLVNFQKKVYNSIHPDTMGDLFSIMNRLISAEFHFDGFDRIISIGLKHILSATLVDIFIPYVSSITKNRSLYQFKTWKDFSSWCCSQNTKNTFLTYKASGDDVDALCIVYFAITMPNLPEKLVNVIYTFLSHYMVKASDLKLPPIQINCFLGDPVYATPVKINNKNDYALLLTRGFIYLIHASIGEPKKEILAERLSLSLHSSQSLSIPLLRCQILPIPSDPQTIAFIASEDANIVVNFQTSDSLLFFTILFAAAKEEIEKTTIYPLQVPKSSIHLTFMKNKIHAKVRVSDVSWDVYISSNDVNKAFERANSNQSFKLIPSNEPTSSRLNSNDSAIKVFDSSIQMNTFLDIVLKSSINSESWHSFNISWCLSVLNDMLFSFSSKSSFEGLRVFRISDFSHAIALNSKELLQIQCEYFRSFLFDFKVNDAPILYYASLVCNNSAIIRYLIETNKMAKDDGSRHKRTAFFYALRNPNISILQALLDYSDSFNIDTAANIDGVNISPLIYCLENNDEARALLLLQNGAKVHESLESDSASALEYVISKRNEKMLNLIMPFCGPQVNAPNFKGQFVTHLCIESGFFQGLRIIEALDEHFNPNMFSDVCPHPLHAFLESERKFSAAEMTALLRLAKINVNQYNSKHETPLMVALIKGQNEFVRIIANDSRCNLDLYNDEGMSALSLGVKHKNYEALRILIEAGALVDQPNQDGNTPLFYALNEENINRDITKLLIANSRCYQWYSNGKLPHEVAPDDLRVEIERRRPQPFNPITLSFKPK